MADTVRTADYFYVMVPDKPGEGARILGELKRAGVNLMAYSGFPSGRGAQPTNSRTGCTGMNARRASVASGSWVLKKSGHSTTV